MHKIQVVYIPATDLLVINPLTDINIKDLDKYKNKLRARMKNRALKRDTITFKDIKDLEVSL